jgi:hypothetical protein
LVWADAEEDRVMDKVSACVWDIFAKLFILKIFSTQAESTA